MSSCCASSPSAPGQRLKLTGEGGLLGKLTKMVVEGALDGEMDDHLGYAKHNPTGSASWCYVTECGGEYASA